jgi:hypothetical protein
VHVGNDIGDSASWRAGVSWLSNRADGSQLDDDVDANGAPGDRCVHRQLAHLGGRCDLKWAPHGNVRPRINSSCRASTCIAPKTASWPST